MKKSNAKVTLYNDGIRDMLTQLYGKKIYISDDMGDIVKHFNWGKKLLKDYEQEIRETMPNDLSEHERTSSHYEGPLDSNAWANICYGELDDDTTMIVKWLEKYETGKFVVYFYEEMGGDERYAWYIIKLQRRK